MVEMVATLYGVGVGPGDPELLTIKAHNIIRSAKIIAYPIPDKGKSFSRQIVANFIPAHCVEIPIIIPMATQRFPAQEIYEKASIHIQTYLQKGLDVVVLCEGDPFFYGSFMYLFSRLASKFPTQVIPGVSALSAVSAAAQYPLCARNSCLKIIPAPLEESKLRALLENGGAVAFVKVGRHLEKIKNILKEVGLDKRAIFVAHATLFNQQICALNDAPKDAPYFSMIIIADKDPYV